jgi:hypothetical protein
MSRKLFVGFIAFLAIVALASQFILKHRPAPAKISTQNVRVVGNGMLAVNINPTQTIRIGIIGESRGDETTSEPFNRDVLTKLLEVLMQRKVQVIFFTGNSVMGWTKLTSELQKANNKKKVKSPIYMVNKSPNWEPEKQHKYISNPQAFQEQLASFYNVVSQTLGQRVAFFPLMGTHEAIGPEAAAIFRKQFHLDSSAPFDPHVVAYTVSIGDAFFILISTDYYSPSAENVVNHRLSQELMAWVEQMLLAGTKNHKYVFVVGHEPAFSTSSIFSSYPGLDEDQHQRDFFWNLLRGNGVLAYFASQEHLYDRSNRDGVWQVVSGGGGAPLETKGGVNAFFHALLLTIPPAGSESAPKLEVLDVDGNVKDIWEMHAKEQALHQLRIK